MNSKQQILKAIRRQKLAEVELPDLEQSWTTYDDRQIQFAEMLRAVGGRCVVVTDVKQINRELEQTAAYCEAKRVCSLVESVGTSNVDLDAIENAHDTEDIDFAILPGHFAVAENAAVWVTDEGMKHRVLPFIVQHLALIVPSEEIVDNMHQAYRRLGFKNARFGVFISGPSKTADIEQSLVIGAHGPRSLTVFLMRK